MYIEEPGHGWQFVPIPGVLPPPREFGDNEYYPLHVKLVPDTYPENCPHTQPHQHICFMGDDGRAWVWAPIESKPFLDHVLDWFGSKEPSMYGAKVEHIRQALEPIRAELPDEMTAQERALVEDPKQWDRPATSYWVMLE
jgi:hypothetical protein